MFARLPITVSILILILSGCNTLPHGNFTNGLSPAGNEVIATDVVGQLARLYPPASTTLSMQYATNDFFGKTLTKELRHIGYAVQAFLPNLIVGPESASSAPIKTASGLGLTYVLDQHDDLYRISIRIDGELLTRAYLAQANQVLPAGEWVQLTQKK